MQLRSSYDYKTLLKALFPRGRAWNKDDGSNFDNVIYGMADELSRLDGRCNDLVKEEEPSIASALLAEYETDFGVDNSLLTTAQREAILHAMNTALGSQADSAFISMALLLGYSIILEYFPPFWAGIGTGSSPCGDQTNIFFWRADVLTGPNLGGFDFGFDPGFSAPRSMSDIDPYINMCRQFRSLISKFDAFKPAHTVVLYTFYGPGFNLGFDMGFQAVPADDESSPCAGFDCGFGIGFNCFQTYDGVSLTGGFDRGFDIGFAAYHGGGFDWEFDSGFERPS